MIDLTPLDVRKKRGDFRRVLRGYDPEEVDTFMELVAERFEELVRANLSLTERTERLERQVGAMEGRERAVQDALVSAQKLREEVSDQSRRDADVLREHASRTIALMRAEAESEIARRLTEAEELVRERQRALEDLERSRLKFLRSFRGLLERELDAVEVEEARKPLEDVPLELEFRGWMPTADQREAEVLEDETPEALEMDVAEEVAAAVESQGEPDEALPVHADDEAGPEESWEADGEAAWADETEEEAGSELETPEEPESGRGEPKWLFSLLKKDEDEGGVGG